MDRYPWQLWDTDGVAEAIEASWRTCILESPHRDTVVDLVSRHLNLPQQTVLEVGCGTGLIYERLVPQHLENAKYVGLDASSAMLRIARRKFSVAHFVRGDGYALPFSDRSFDVVICFEVLGHLPEIGPIVRELLRVTKRTCLFTVSNSESEGIVDEAEDILGKRFLHRRYPDGYMRKALAEAGAIAPNAVQVAVLSAECWAYIVHLNGADVRLSPSSVFSFPGYQNRVLRMAEARVDEVQHALNTVREELQDLRQTLEEKDERLLDVNLRLIEIQHSVAWKVARKLESVCERLLFASSERINIYWKLRRTLEVLVDEGARAVFQRTSRKIHLMLMGRGLRVRVPTRNPGHASEDLSKQYAVWTELHRLTDRHLRRLEQAVRQLAHRPLVSILTPVYETDKILLRKAIESVRAQVYPDWELCLVNDRSRKPHVKEMLDEYAAVDPRIRVTHLSQNEGIVGASARALAMATGEFVGLLDHDDELTPDALFEVVSRLNQTRDLDVIYSDEDKTDAEDRRLEPFFKPNWSPDLLLSMNYITHFAVFRRSLLIESGGFRPGYDGSQDYDLLLRVTERTERIAHVARILYHWRKHPRSAAMSIHAKPHAYEAARRALEDALQRRGVEGKVEQLDPGRYRVRYALREAPIISIVISTRDRRELLQQCLESVESKTEYRRYEIIVVDNDSVEPTTLEYLDTIGRKHRVLRFPGSFNFAAINNVGAERAHGDYLLFLNNDITVVRPEWLGAMLEHARRPDVGAVGAKLLYPDGRIQHAGLVLGVGGPAGHAFKLQADGEPGYHGLADVVRDCSAVTGACMMIRRRQFEDAGGFDIRFKVAYNDLDLCLKLRAKGYRVIYTPFAVLYHYESATRGRMTPPDEEALCWKLWGDVIRRGDPYYNPNLTRVREDWSLDLTRSGGAAPTHQNGDRT
jgi:GT2 family glycosyltransferase/ubiquinone/menaquinone biosynthesis C-methylase UbiE